MNPTLDPAPVLEAHRLHCKREKDHAVAAVTHAIMAFIITFYATSCCDSEPTECPQYPRVYCHNRKTFKKREIEPTSESSK